MELVSILNEKNNFHIIHFLVFGMRKYSTPAPYL